MLPVVRRWTPALALVALAGLFAMHGIGDHTAGHSGLPGASGHHAAMATAMAPDVLPGDGPATEPAAPGDGGGAMALCLAVLVGGAVALAWLALHGRTDRAWRRTRWAAGRLPRSRDPDPPRLALLGVCRC